jgi:hypothetical protein
MLENKGDDDNRADKLSGLWSENASTWDKLTPFFRWWYSLTQWRLDAAILRGKRRYDIKLTTTLFRAFWPKIMDQVTDPRINPKLPLQSKRFCGSIVAGGVP